MHLWTVRGAVLAAAAPGISHGMIVKAGDAVPGLAAIFASKQSLRRRSRIPNPRLTRMSRREPERVIEDETFFSILLLWKRRRALGLLPGLSQIRGEMHRRPKMPGARGREQ